MDLDLSDMGPFSLSPQDLVRMGMATEAQIGGTKFNSSTNLDSLPQLVNIAKEIEVLPFWGQPEVCQLAITRTDFDLVKEIIGGQTDKEVPRCPHGARIWKTGQTKNGKAWGHWKCIAAATGEIDRCPKGEDVLWYEISSAGNWVPQKGRD
jgi:hypothetical protein